MKYTGDRISVSEAAEMLGMECQKVRTLMKNEKLNIGYVIKASDRCTYYIYKSLVVAWIKKLGGVKVI